MLRTSVWILHQCQNVFQRTYWYNIGRTTCATRVSCVVSLTLGLLIGARWALIRLVASYWADGVRPGAAVRASESLPDNRWDDRPRRGPSNAVSASSDGGRSNAAAPTVTAAAAAAGL